MNADEARSLHRKAKLAEREARLKKQREIKNEYHTNESYILHALDDVLAHVFKKIRASAESSNMVTIHEDTLEDELRESERYTKEEMIDFLVLALISMGYGGEKVDDGIEIRW